MIPLDFSSSFFFCTHEGAKELLIDRSRLSLMAWLHAKLQYINSEWYKTENKTRVHIIIINIRELRGWILKYFLKGVFCSFFFWHVWDFVKTSGKTKRNKFSLGKKESSTWMHSCCPQNNKQNNMITFMRTGVTYQRKLKKICPTMKPSSSSHPAE